MSRTTWIHAVALSSLAIAACNNGDGKPAPSAAATGQTAAAPAKTTAAAPAQTAGGAPATPKPAETGYTLAAIHTVADDCASASVILSSAPKKVGADYAWPVSRQALLANQQFHVVAGEPTAPGQVHLATYEQGESYALVATCKDGGTCNQLAAMYKGIVRSSVPQVVCGKRSGLSASPVHAFDWADTPQGNLPGEKDTVAACARLNACMIATDRSTPGDPFLECQKAPSHFKTQCARRYPCADVLACAGH